MASANGRSLSEFIAMRIIHEIAVMQSWSENQRCRAQRLVFVPTMGFLHEGHLSLVRDAKTRGDKVVVSVFVNPAQFSPDEDFATYPRDFERDRQLLDHEGIDVLFTPSVDEIYPEGYQTYIKVGKLSGTLCGAFRPGHFRGVATIVAKLFNIVRPHVAIFGRKDYQQLQIIRRLVRDLNLPIDILGHPTVREPDGLAMSSRNAYLDPQQRQAALCLSRALRMAGALVGQGERRAQVILETVMGELKEESLACLEYASLIDAESLQDVDQLQAPAVLALAVRIGKARLIDNQLFEI
jgi:pantoate--beta-alanine ligase